MPKRPSQPFDVISSGSILSLSSFYSQAVVIDTQARLLSEMFYADPILFLLGNYHRYLKLTRYYVRVIDNPVPELTLRTKNIYFFAVQAIRRYQRRKKKLSEPESSWHQRRSRSVYGTTQYRNSLSHTVQQLMGSGFVSPSSLASTQVDLTYYSDAGVMREHVSFDNLLDFVKYEMSQYIGSTFRRNTTLSRYGTAILSGLTWSEDEITCVWSSLVWQSFPVSRKMTSPGLTVTIRRGDPDTPYGISVSVSGLSSILVDNTKSLGYPHWNANAYTSHVVSLGSRYDTDVLIGGESYAYSQSMALVSPVFRGIMSVFDSEDGINQFRPGWYHTQSKALSDAQLQIGKNLQNVLQAPGMLDLLADIFTADVPGTFRHLFDPTLAQNFLEQVLRLALFLSCGKLALDFAILPSWRALNGILGGFVGPLSTEGSFSIKGSNLSSEDQTFRNLFRFMLRDLNLVEADIRRYDIKFRSQLYTSVEYQHLAFLLATNNPLVAIGAVPTPLDIWKYAQGSFAVDWALNVGPLIDEHQQYLQSMTMPFRIGHSVHWHTTFKDGRTYEFYARSTEMSLPLDPPGVTWLPVSTFHVNAIPLGIQQLFRSPINMTFG